MFQMRPYPSPGAVLQANAAAQKNKDANYDDSDKSDGGDRRQNDD